MGRSFEGGDGGIEMLLEVIFHGNQVLVRLINQRFELLERLLGLLPHLDRSLSLIHLPVKDLIITFFLQILISD